MASLGFKLCQGAIEYEDMRGVSVNICDALQGQQFIFYIYRTAQGVDPERKRRVFWLSFGSVDSGYKLSELDYLTTWQ